MAELNGKYVNEENHQKVKTKLKKTGKLLMIIGAILTVLGAVLLIIGIIKMASPTNINMEDPNSSMNNAMGKSFGSFTLVILGGFCLFPGIASLVYGVYATFFAHARDIASFASSSITPVVNDTVNYVADNTAPAIGRGLGNITENIAGGITRGIVRGKAVGNTLVCKKCNQPNKKNSKFCANCGEALQEKKFCNKCGQELENDSKFCANCGEKAE